MSQSHGLSTKQPGIKVSITNELAEVSHTCIGPIDMVLDPGVKDGPLIEVRIIAFDHTLGYRVRPCSMSSSKKEMIENKQKLLGASSTYLLISICKHNMLILSSGICFPFELI